ncbi:MAG: hypothetical protein JW891_05205 [Candidatus Lokiarchaeota archaeon]|nr:hypothetical protein [Candidatus Lokiarchaeota archaeon]
MQFLIIRIRNELIKNLVNQDERKDSRFSNFAYVLFFPIDFDLYLAGIFVVPHDSNVRDLGRF